MELTAASCAGVSVAEDSTWRYGGGGLPTATTGRQPAAHVPHAHVPSAVRNLEHLRHVLGCPWSARAPSLAAWAGDREALMWLLAEGCPHDEQEGGGGGALGGPGAAAVWGSGGEGGSGAAVLQRVPGGLMAAAACRRDVGFLEWVACEVQGMSQQAVVGGEEAAGTGSGGDSGEGVAFKVQGLSLQGTVEVGAGVGMGGEAASSSTGSGSGGGEGVVCGRRERLRVALSAEVFTAAVTAVAAAVAVGANGGSGAARGSADRDMTPAAVVAATATATAPDVDMGPAATGPSTAGPSAPGPSAAAWPKLPPLAALRHASASSGGARESPRHHHRHHYHLNRSRHGHSTPRSNSCSYRGEAAGGPCTADGSPPAWQPASSSTARSNSCSYPGEAPSALPLSPSPSTPAACGAPSALPLPQPGTPPYSAQRPCTPTATPTAWQAAALLPQPGTPSYSAAQQPCTPTTQHFGPQQHHDPRVGPSPCQDRSKDQDPHAFLQAALQRQQQRTIGPASCQAQDPHAFLQWLLNQGCPVDFGAAAVAAAAQGSRATLEWLRQHADQPNSNGCVDVHSISAAGAAVATPRTAGPMGFGPEALVAAARSRGGLPLVRWLLDEAGCEAGGDPAAVLRAAVQGPPAAFPGGGRGRGCPGGEQEQDEQEDDGRVALVAWLCDRLGLCGRLEGAAGTGMLEAAIDALAAESPAWPQSQLPATTPGPTVTVVPPRSQPGAPRHGQGRGRGQAGTGVVRWLLQHGGCRPSPAAMQRAAAAGRADLLDLMLRNQLNGHLYGSGGGAGGGHVAGWAPPPATPLVRQELLAAACGSGSVEAVAWVLQAAGRLVALPPGLLPPHVLPGGLPVPVPVGAQHGAAAAVQQQVPVALGGVEVVEGSVRLGQECFEAAAGGGHLQVLQYMAAAWWAEHVGEEGAGSGRDGGGGGGDGRWPRHPGAPWRASSVLAAAASSAAAGAGHVVRWLVEVAGAEAADAWVMCGAAYGGDLARMQYLYGSAGARPTAEAFLVCAWAGRVRQIEWLVRQAGCPMQEDAWIWPGHRRDVHTLDALERLGCPHGPGALLGVAGLGTDVAVLRWLYVRYGLPLDERLADAVPGAEQREEVAAWVREVRAGGGGGGGGGGRAGGKGWGPAGGLVRLAAAAFRRPW